MSKKVQKTLTGAMAAMMATGVVATPAMAATNKTDIDAVYKAAYQATKKAMEAKTLEEQQNAINEARTAIKALKALPANLGWAVGEFSKQVDKVQHPILVNIIKTIDEAKKAKNQESINIAREAIPTTLNPTYKNSYNSALDKVQQELINNATAAVKKAETDKTKKSIDEAKLLVNDLATAIRPGVKNIATTLNKRLESIFTLKVTNFTLNPKGTGVTVEFEPTTEILKDVTITVVDNNGKEISVQKVDRILAGKSKQVFTFERVLADTNFQGIWTVNGVSIDMTEARLVKNVVEQNNKALIALQEAGYINGLLGSYKNQIGSNTKSFVFDTINDKSAEAYYNEAIQKESAKSSITTATQIQDIINKTNENLGVSADEKGRVELIIKASNSGNATQFVNALDAENIERVNSDWAVDGKDLGFSYINYASKITNATSLKDIQNAIDEANLTNVDRKLQIVKLSSIYRYNMDKVSEISELANAYLSTEQKVTVNGKDVVARDYYNNFVKEQLALIDVREADNTSTLLRTLKALSEVSDKFDYDTYGYDINIDAYKAEVDKIAQNDFSVEKVLSAVKDANLNVITTTIKAVENSFENLATDIKYTDAQKKTINEALDKLVAVTAKEVNVVNVTTGKTTKVNKFDKAIVKLDLEKYQSVSGTDVDSLYSSFEAINDAEAGNTVANAIAAVKNAKNANDLYTALSNELLSIDNVLESNKAEYWRDAAQFVSAATDVENADLIVKAVTSVNARAEMLKATTVDAMAKGLTKLAISEEATHIINMSADNRRDVAEEILNNKAFGIINLETIEEALKIENAQAKVTKKLQAVNDSIKFEDGKVLLESRAKLIDALNAVTGVDKLTLDSKIESFMIKSTIKNSSGVVTNKVTYTNYTEIRNSLK